MGDAGEQVAGVGDEAGGDEADVIGESEELAGEVDADRTGGGCGCLAI